MIDNQNCNSHVLRENLLLLIHSNEDDDVEIDASSSLDACYQILGLIEERESESTIEESENGASDESNSSFNARKLLGNIPSSTVSKIPAVLARLQAHRHEASHFLPATQDEAANADAMFGLTSAKTISEVAMAAGRLYATMISVPGALGAGLIDVGALSGMSALLKRWIVECRGREPGTSLSKSGSSKPAKRDSSSKARRHKHAGSDKPCERKKKKLNTPPKKRKRDRVDKSTTVEEIESGHSSSEECLSLSSQSDSGRHSSKSTTKQKKDSFSESEALSSVNDDLDSSRRGLLLSLSVARVLHSQEFRCWSIEAREAIVEASISALTCTSALFVGCSDNSVCREFQELCASVERNLKMGLEKCLSQENFNFHVYREEQENFPGCGSNDIPPKMSCKTLPETKALPMIYIKTITFVLRGVYPYLSHNAETPNGNKGRVAAYNVASDLLKKVVHEATSVATKTQEILLTQKDTSREALTTSGSSGESSKGRHSIFYSVKKCERRMKSSAPTPNILMSKDVNSPEKMQPSLKAAVTPKSVRFRRRNHVDQEEKMPRYNEHFPRPPLASVIGLMQKLSTLNNLNKADARARTITILSECLEVIPSLERSYFLRFLSKLSLSRRPTHRLFAIEFIGHILSEKWLWEEHRANETYHYSELAASTSQDPGDRSYWISGIGSRSASKFPPLTLLISLQGRLDDKTPVVRARAAISLSSLLSSCTAGERKSLLMENEIGYKETIFEGEKELLRNTVAALSLQLLHTLRGRAQRDDRASVRTAAMRCFMYVLMIDFSQLSGDKTATSLTSPDIDIFILGCSDSSTSARKAAAESITSLLGAVTERAHMKESQEMLEWAWISAVLPLTVDYEQSCSAKAIELVCEIIVNPLIFEDQQNNDRKVGFEQNAWRILARIGSSQQQAGSGRTSMDGLCFAIERIVASDKAVAKRLLKKSCASVCFTLGLEGESDPLDPALFEANLDNQRRGSWCMMQVLARCSFKSRDSVGSNVKGFTFTSKIFPSDISFISKAWDKLKFISTENIAPEEFRSSIAYSSQACLELMVEVAKMMPPASARETFESINTLLLDHELSLDLISCAITALVSLLVGLEGSKTNDRENVTNRCREWASKVYESCQNRLESLLSFVLSNNKKCLEVPFQSKVERAIYTVGEVAMVGFSADQDNTKLSKKDVILQSDPVIGFRFLPSEPLLDLVRTLLPAYLLSKGPEQFPTPVVARAHAFVTVGKICLRDEAFAKECITILSRELQHSNAHGGSNPLVQSNALVVLGDLCVRYTNIVDRHLPEMAACLQSRAFSQKEEKGYDLVRKHSVLLMSSLLLQDFIKWRGLLVHRFLAATVDESPSVSRTAEATLCGPLLSKQTNLFQNNFVEAIFVLNDCHAHLIYTAASKNGCIDSGFIVGTDGIRLSGTSGRAKRMQIYRMMLSRMTDEEKISVSARLAREVLGGALELSGDLRASCCLKEEIDSSMIEDRKLLRLQNAANVVKDTLTILSSPWCRVAKPRSMDKESYDPDVDLSTLAISRGNQMVTVKGRLLSKISRKHLIETVVPILCNLKVVLEDNCSPLIKDLMLYLVDIFRNYKTEVKELLAGNPTLLQEIEYDTKQFEKAKREIASSRKKTQLVLERSYLIESPIAPIVLDA